MKNLYKFAKFNRSAQNIASMFGFFQPSPNTPMFVNNFEKNNCDHLDKIHELMQPTHIPSVSYLNNPIPPVRLKQEIFRAYPFVNVFNRVRSDAGPTFIHKSLIDDIHVEGDTYSMQSVAEKDPGAIYTHIAGLTKWRSYSSRWGVAAAFGLTKIGENGAACLEQVNHAGCQLQAFLYPLSDPDHRQHLEAEIYQREHGSPFMPAARLSCISILSKKDGLFDPTLIFNILNPLDANIQAFILANECEKAIQMLHHYDQYALKAATNLSQAYYDIMHQEGLSPAQQHARYEKFQRAYEHTCSVEKKFRLQINSRILSQKAQGNSQMKELSELQDLDVHTANKWFATAKSLAKGCYLRSSSAQPIELQLDDRGEYSVHLPMETGKDQRLVLNARRVLEMLPGDVLGPFSLLSSNGSLKKKELPHQLGQAVATSFISELLRRKDYPIDRSQLEYVGASKESVESGLHRQFDDDILSPRLPG